MERAAFSQSKCVDILSRFGQHPFLLDMENGVELETEEGRHIDEKTVERVEEVVPVLEEREKEAELNQLKPSIKGYRLNSTTSMDTVSIRSTTTSPDGILREQAGFFIYII